MEDEVDVGQEIEVDESICISCGGSTYEGETISCETCLRWFHFLCVGVSHEDDCVRMEDVPYYCPTCHLKTKKGKKGRRPSRPAKPKPKKKVKPSPKERSGGGGRREPPPLPDGIKLKISLKTASASADKPTTPGIQDPSNHSEESNSSIDQPLIIDEIMPRSVKVGRRRPSQRHSEENVRSEERFGLELRNENLQAYLQTEQVPDHQHEVTDQMELVSGLLPSVNRGGLEGEEERWLAAVEEGNLEKIQMEDSELRSVRDPTALTARQKALQLKEPDNEELYQALDFGQRKRVEASDESQAEKLVKAAKRKELETEKREKMKQRTMDLLLKKKDSKIARQLKTSKPATRDDVPKIVYIQNMEGTLLSFSGTATYPLKKQGPRLPPPTVHCAVCSQPKKYSCSKTGKPLCTSLRCYKLNLNQSAVVAV